MANKNQPFISICIPAYKNTSYLKRLLDSIAIQTFKDYDVFISDDSPDDAVEKLVATYSDRIPEIVYKSNSRPRGMPDNWNYAISQSKGQWKKIMHDDDWFSDKDSLSIFAAEAQKEDIDFVFSNYVNQYLNKSKSKIVVFPKYKLKKVEENPLLLMSGNLIGPPSVCMIRAEVMVMYNPDLHWLVDIDYYIQVLLKKVGVAHISKALICIGVNQEQVTQSVKNNPTVEIGEAKKILDRYHGNWLKNIVVYDGWWRLLRNMKIKSYDQLTAYGGGNWPDLLIRMLEHQRKVPNRLLKRGIFSKIFMFGSYLSQLPKMKD